MNTRCSSSISERILSFADMWDVDHPGPPAMHKIILVYPGRIAGPTFPTISCSDEGTIMTLLNSASSRKLTLPAVLLPHAKTGQHCTTSYHWNPLGKTSPPRICTPSVSKLVVQSWVIYFGTEGVRLCTAMISCCTSLYFCYDFPTLWTKWGMNVSVSTIVWSIAKPTILGAWAIGRSTTDQYKRTTSSSAPTFLFGECFASTIARTVASLLTPRIIK